MSEKTVMLNNNLERNRSTVQMSTFLKLSNLVKVINFKIGSFDCSVIRVICLTGCNVVGPLPNN